MVLKRLKPVACPRCRDGTLLHIEIDENVIKSATRYPVIVAVKCSKGHALIAFVDANFEIRDIESAAEAETKESTGVSSVKQWLDTL